MWADLLIRVCVFIQTDTWINEGASCVPLHTTGVWGEGQKGTPQAQHCKSGFGQPAIRSLPSHTSSMPHWLWPVSAFFHCCQTYYIQVHTFDTSQHQQRHPHTGILLKWKEAGLYILLWTLPTAKTAIIQMQNLCLFLNEMVLISVKHPV